MREAFLKRLFTMIKCESCGHTYRVSDIEILGHEEYIWLFNVSCGHCRTQGLVAIVVREANIEKWITDLTEAEYGSFAQAATVEINDVLDMHNFLKEFDGNFASILSDS
ncbi:MAG: hypothetical protein FJ004_07010 [Chloroflexi bacterium]|nr:hypothetical protein [Chloroflexota bacterium]